MSMRSPLNSLIASGLLVLCSGCGSAAALDSQTSEPTAPSAPENQPAHPIEQHEPPQAERPADQQPANDKLDPEIDALLDRLEKSADDLTSFTAKIVYEKTDAILGRPETRTGELIYRRDAKTGEKSFAALFDALIIGEVRRTESKHFVFSGRWLAEIDAKERQFIKREIVPPGKELNPLKLGEGPFPIPIGQAKTDVLARFDVTAAAVPEAGLLKPLKNVQGLTLTPKAGTQEAKTIRQVRVYYDRDSLLPVGVDLEEGTSENPGDRKVIRLIDAKRNPELDEAQQAKLSIKEPDPNERPQWRIDIRPWSDAPNDE